MAEAYANPIPAPEFMEPDGSFNHQNYEKRIEKYREDTLDYIRTQLKGKHKYTGKILRFPVGDGYAAYMIWTPAKWIHLEEVDAWHADPALIRGMRAADVAERIESQERLDALFGR